MVWAWEQAVVVVEIIFGIEDVVWKHMTLTLQHSHLLYCDSPPHQKLAMKLIPSSEFAYETWYDAQQSLIQYPSKFGDVSMGTGWVRNENLNEALKITIYSPFCQNEAFWCKFHWFCNNVDIYRYPFDFNNSKRFSCFFFMY